MRDRKSIYVAVAAALVVLLAAFVVALAMNSVDRAAAAKPSTQNGHARVAGYGAWSGRRVASYGTWSGRRVAGWIWSGRRVAVGLGGCGVLAA